ncbi:MAG: polysaccharide pyruvyl transferase CsaB [Oscillospiraceae bacterium]|nr:polysaccharide pyruvyl transferase CsaB [Oscillospiraceae bacterium]
MGSLKIVISGYYGFDNCGDEAVLLSIIHCLKKLDPDVRITVLSNAPEKTRELYGVDVANRWNLIAVAQEILTARLLISGGGSLIQDATSVRSPAYYLLIIRLALFFKKKVMIYAQGVGPLTDRKNQANTAKLFDRCNAITLRDSGSAQLLRELGVKGEIHVTCDPVMALGSENVSVGAVSKLLLDLGVFRSDGKKGNPLLFVSVRHWKDDRHFAPVAKILDTQASKGWDVLLVPAHFPEDLYALRALCSSMTSQPYIIETCLTAKEFLALAEISDRVFSMRLHGLICAMAVGTPMVGLSYDPKVDSFMKQAGIEDFCLSYDDADLESRGIALFEKTEEPSPSLKLRRQEMQKLAWATAKKAIKLMQ